MGNQSIASVIKLSTADALMRISLRKINQNFCLWLLLKVVKEKQEKDKSAKRRKACIRNKIFHKFNIIKLQFCCSSSITSAKQ